MGGGKKVHRGRKMVSRPREGGLEPEARVSADNFTNMRVFPSIKGLRDAAKAQDTRKVGSFEKFSFHGAARLAISAIQERSETARRRSRPTSHI